MLKSLNLCDLTPKSEIEQRIGELKTRMAAKGIDFSVILQNVDLFYFAGTIQKGVLVIPVDGDPLLCIERTIDRAIYESPLQVIPIKRDKDVRDILAGKNVLKGTGAMEFDVVPVSVFERWKGLLGFQKFVDVSPLIKDIRIVKSPFEIDQIKRSGEIISRVFEKARGIVREGMSEVEIGAVLEAEGRMHGHQGFLRMRGLNQEMMKEIEDPVSGEQSLMRHPISWGCAYFRCRRNPRRCTGAFYKQDRAGHTCPHRLRRRL